MRRSSLMYLMFIACTVGAAGQSTGPATDHLAAHLIYVRGCTACHIPHRGAEVNETAKAPGASARSVILWGDDVTGLYEKTIATRGGKSAEVQRARVSTEAQEVSGLLTCLSCHDGNLAQRPVMKERSYERLPAHYGNTASIPTLVDDRGPNSVKDNPAGPSAQMNCGGTSDFDCTQTSGVVSMTGANMSRFVTNDRLFMKPGSRTKGDAVVCTTCHDPHVMNMVPEPGNSTPGLRADGYATMFFLSAAYHPKDSNPTP